MIKEEIYDELPVCGEPGMTARQLSDRLGIAVWQIMGYLQYLRHDNRVVRLVDLSDPELDLWWKRDKLE